MYDENEDKVPLITLALNCIKEIFKSRIISDTGDLLGVVLFGTSKVNNPNDLASIYVLLELDVPDPESILYLETLEKTPQWMMSQLGSLERYAKVKFQELLFTCRSLLNHAVRSKTLNVRKRLLLFTDDDDPIENDENVKNLNIRQARDLSESGMNIELLPLKSSRSKPFDYHLFYEDVIGSSRQELEPVSDPISRFEELQLHILKKKYKKRVLNNTFLYLNGLQNEGAHAELETVGLEVYALFHRPSRSKKVFLEARNNEPVRRVTIAYSEESGALLANANDIRYSFPFAGVACVFTHSEMEELGHLCRYGMELIGFENKNKLKWQYNMRPSYFLYPSDHTIKGSQLLMAVLWKQMLQENQIAIVRVCFRRTSHPRLAALVPQDEKKTESHLQTEPCGFHLIWLPFAEEIRKEWKKQYPKWNNLPSQQCVEAAMNVISKLSMPSYDPSKYSDPDIQRYYNGLQALALNQTNFPQVEDTLDTDDAQMAQVAKEELEEWTKIVASEPVGIIKQEKSLRSPKRFHIKRAVEKLRSKQFLEQQLDWKQLAFDKGNDGLEKQNVTTLKMFCAAHDLKKSGRKAELIERIRTYLETEKA
ncbi:ATP-dependent DNA helicase 2 subunit 1 isoform 1 [Galdieria sulphuraria]|uniref:ATP-dependent DNA helicase 2 subunit 1 isoform 1 n=1 Tax=Galdieria sulphuraria TaxID=130081 RepID=M2Y1X4_GALSU|nr:ATP-dependent DNA helicase 2 subunit 1 isoform 1 [Galdieria sulphuraria]EME29814.1 ATP-dependent DNA helicase 2 subunit 1 isoform 1 [Galdieria sulphuraria]|eukprot:XP_005706334.1 ATP-dependent DNA helicase 2 subunit 1 isoform 1 [Galdieria sulphuraria]